MEKVEMSFILRWLRGESGPEPKFEIYKNRKGKFLFRLKAPNGEIIAVSEAYESKAGCENGIESVKKNAEDAVVEDMTK